VKHTKKPTGAQWKHLRIQKKATAAQRADGGPGARGAHSGESCTGIDVNTRGSSCRKRLLSPGGTPQGAQSQVKKPSKAQRKRLRKQKEAPYNSSRPPEVFKILKKVFIVPW